MKTKLNGKRNITPKNAVEILKKNGVEISEEKAIKILDTLYFLSELVIEQNFKKAKE